MRSGRVVGVLVLALACSFCFSKQPKGVSGLVWSWSEDCGSAQKKYLEIQVILGSRPVYKSAIPICRTKYGGKPKTMVFHFKGGHTFQGEHRTLPAETIEGNIWLAGSDPGDVIFGLSFDNKKQILLNTVHRAKINSESTSAIDRGMRVRTFPLDRKSWPLR